MTWVGKVVGGVLGLIVVGGPIGMVLGTFLGHQFDRGAAQVAGGRVRFESGYIQQLFFKTTFEVMGHLAKSDGRVSEDEIRVARRIMHGMSLSTEQIKIAIEHFTSGKSISYPLKDQLKRLNKVLHKRNDLLQAFIEIQMQALVATGPINTEKRELLWQISQNLGIGRVELAQIEALIRAQHHQATGTEDPMASIEQAYRALGINPEATDKEVKIAYRRLMNQHHPDKLVARGMPESMISVAEEKTHKIRAAYDRVKAQRDFK